MASLQNVCSFPDTSLISSFLNLNKERPIKVADYNDEISIFTNQEKIIIAKSNGTTTFDIIYTNKYVLSDIFEDENIPFAHQFMQGDQSISNNNGLKITSTKILTFELAHNLNYYIAIGFNTGHVKFIIPETGDIILSKCTLRQNGPICCTLDFRVF